MTTKQVMQQALEALECTKDYDHPHYEDQLNAIEALKDSLAQQGDPVAWLHAKTNQVFTSEPPPRLKASCTPLYAGAAAQARMKALDEAKQACLQKHANGNWKHDTREECAAAIESLKGKV